MLKIFQLLVVGLLFASCGGGSGSSSSVTSGSNSSSGSNVSESTFGLFLKLLIINTDLPSEYSATSGNKSIGLVWANAPTLAQSYCIIMEDVDAINEGSTFVHWNVFNIPATSTELLESASGSSMPEGSIEGLNSTGSVGYYGPNPPSGEVHRYSIKIYAMRTDSLSVTSQSSYTQSSFGSTFSTSIIDSTETFIKFSQ